MAFNTALEMEEGTVILEDATLTELITLPPLAAFSDATAEPAGSGFDAMPPAERDRLLMEHLPAVRYLARRIHERLPQHVELEDLVSAGMWA